MQRRRGFTITELLVAMALMMFIMAVLAEAFHAGLESFRQLKSVGDMDQRLRTAASLLRRDLDANVLQVSKNNYKKVSELGTQSPTTGFFTIGEDVGGGMIRQTPPGVVINTTPPQSVTVTLSSPPPPSLSALQPGMPFLLYGASGTKPVMLVVLSISGNTITLDPNGVDLQSLLPGTQFLAAQWDVPNGKYDNPNGPGTSSAFGDADGQLSPFATTFKLHFSIDLGAPPKGSGSPTRKQRRENFVAVAAPKTILLNPANGLPDPGSAYSPFIFQNNDDGLQTPAANPQPLFIPPFEDPVNHMTQTAEVAYFLRDNGTRTPDGQQKLYTFYRRELALAVPVKGDSLNKRVKKNNNPKNKIAVPDGSTNHPWPNSYHGFSGIPDTSTGFPPTAMRFNTHDDVSSPPNRCLTYAFFNSGVPAGWNIPAFPVLGDRGEPPSLVGSDILLTDVLSFSVRILPNPMPDPSKNLDSNGNPIVDPFLFPGTPYKDASNNVWRIYGEFDTAYMSAFDNWNNQSPPPPFKLAGVQALELVIRVYDHKTQRTRQITILQAM